MKQKFISIFILILLSSCSSIAPAPIATALAVSTNTPLPTEPPTSVPTQTPAPTENPALEYQKIEKEYIATLSPEQKALYGQYNSKDRTAEGLTKRFLDGDLSTYLAYVDMNKDSKDFEEVTSVWNPEQQKSNPALLIENNLFINENSASEIIWNPDLDKAKAKQTMTEYMKYVRAQACAKNNGVDLPNTLEKALSDPNAMNYLNEGCVITLHKSSGGRNHPYNVPEQSIFMSGKTEIVIKFVSEPNLNMTFTEKTADKDNYHGWSFSQAGNIISISYFNQGTEDLTEYREYKNMILARRIANIFRSMFSRASGSSDAHGKFDEVSMKEIFNFETLNETIPPIIFSINR